MPASCQHGASESTCPRCYIQQGQLKGMRLDGLQTGGLQQWALAGPQATDMVWNSQTGWAQGNQQIAAMADLAQLQQLQQAAYFSQRSDNNLDATAIAYEAGQLDQLAGSTQANNERNRPVLAIRDLLFPADEDSYHVQYMGTFASTIPVYNGIAHWDDVEEPFVPKTETERRAKAAYETWQRRHGEAPALRGLTAWDWIGSDE